MDLQNELIVRGKIAAETNLAMDLHSASTISPAFQCCVCRDLLCKPVVLACGHVCCFWCTLESMDGFRPSRCLICRQQYNRFPRICVLLHFLLLKLEPLSYKTREKEIFDEEKMQGRFSPQLVSENADADKCNSSIVEEIENSVQDSRPRRRIALYGFLQEGAENNISDRVTAADVLCSGCKELLFRPSVLNCGHVYCESCIPGTINGCLQCRICESLHYSDYPKICWELDLYLQEQFPKEYTSRKEKSELKNLESQHGEPSDSVLETQKHNANSSYFTEDCGFYRDLSSAHIGVGCDACGRYPITGKRYKCKDCKENFGFDLCQQCYDSNTNSNLVGRFNQRHSLGHKLELDETMMLCKLMMKSDMIL